MTVTCCTTAGRYAHTTHIDGSVKTWDLESGTLHRTHEGHRGRAWYVSACSVLGMFATVGLDGEVRLWDREGEKPLAVAYLGESVTACEFRGGKIAVGMRSGAARILSVLAAPRGAADRGPPCTLWEPAASDIVSPDPSTRCDIVLYMHGTKTRPRGLYSWRAVEALSQLAWPYDTVNVLDDEQAARQAIRASGFPSFPQLFIGGTFVGTSDTMHEMLVSGFLHRRLARSRQ